MMYKDGINVDFVFWDWCYYVEKWCKVEYDLDEVLLKFYL